MVCVLDKSGQLLMFLFDRREKTATHMDSKQNKHAKLRTPDSGCGGKNKSVSLRDRLSASCELSIYTRTDLMQNGDGKIKLTNYFLERPLTRVEWHLFHVF